MNKDLKDINKKIQYNRSMYEHIVEDFRAQLKFSIEQMQKCKNEMKEKGIISDDAGPQKEKDPEKILAVVWDSIQKYNKQQEISADTQNDSQSNDKKLDVRGDVKPKGVPKTTELPLDTNRPTEQYNPSNSYGQYKKPEETKNIHDIKNQNAINGSNIKRQP